MEHLTNPLLPCTLSDSLLSDLAPSHPGPYPLGIPVLVTKAIMRSWVPAFSADFHLPAGIRYSVKGIPLAYRTGTLLLLFSRDSVTQLGSRFQVLLVQWAWRWCDLGPDGASAHSVPLWQYGSAELWESSTFTAGNEQVASLSRGRHYLISQGFFLETQPWEGPG